MSNKSIAVYAQAMQRQKEEEQAQSQSNPVEKSGDARHARQASSAIPESSARHASSAIPERHDLPLDDTLEAFISTTFGMKSSHAVNFRCPPELNTAIDAVLPHAEIQAGTRISKTRVFVFALAYALWDFHHNGPESQLVAFFKKS